ncbi:MAG: CoA transferase [Hyphomonadaceae bacterium]|nr:CoA transferase [Hyphomonadaceae bacterium]
MSKRPMEGLFVVDFTAMVAGASCTRALADCGADVVKVESAATGGDLMRHAGPKLGGVGLIYGLYNTGKKSISLNLKSEAGLAVARRLVDRADIVVENFRPGVMARLGLGYDLVSKTNPKLIYASISGFGQYGPLSDRAAYAPVAHAYSSFDMMLSRSVDPTAPPLDNRVMIADILAGANGFAAIQTALVHRLRHGMGSYVDITMAEGMMHLVGMQLQFAQADPSLTLTAHYPAYKTLDGYVSIPLVSTNTFRLLFQVMEREDWLADTALRTSEGLALRKSEIYENIAHWTATRTSQECDRLMTAAGVPCAIYLMPEEVLDEPHSAVRGSFGKVATSEGEFKVLNPPFQISTAAVGALPHTSGLGEDTRTVLASRLGLDDAELDRLEADGAFS